MIGSLDAPQAEEYEDQIVYKTDEPPSNIQLDAAKSADPFNVLNMNVLAKKKISTNFSSDTYHPDLPPDGSVLAATFRRRNMIGNWLTTIDPADYDNQEFEKKEYNYLDYIPQDLSYEYGHLYAGTKNPEHAEALTAQLRLELQDAAVMDNAPWRTFGSTFLASIVDPTILFPGGAIYRSTKMAHGIAKTALSAGLWSVAGETASQVVAQQTQLTKGLDESFFEIIGAGIVGSVIGGGFGAYFNGAIATAAKKEIVKTLADEAPIGPTMTIEQSLSAAKTRDPAYEKELNSLYGGTATAAIGKFLGYVTQNLTPQGRLFFSPFATSRSIVNELTEHNLITNAQVAHKKKVMGPDGKEIEVDVEAAPRGVSVESELKEFKRSMYKKLIDYQNIFYRQAGIKGPFKGLQKALTKQGLSIIDFEKQVWRTIVSGKKSENKDVQEASDLVMKEFFEPIKEEYIRLGVFSKDIQVKTAASYFMRFYNREKIRNPIQRAKTKAKFEAFIKKNNEELIGLEAQMPKIKELQETISILEPIQKKFDEFAKQTKGRFHGTPKELDPENLKSINQLSFSSKNVYGEGFYTTNDVGLAATYTEKGWKKAADQGKHAPSIYNIEEKSPVKLKNIDASIADDKEIANLVLGLRKKLTDSSLLWAKKVLDKVAGGGEISNNIPLSKLIDMLRDSLIADKGTPRAFQEFLEHFFIRPLEAKGYRGFSHEGGRLTKGQPHGVNIYWHPKEDLNVKKIETPKNVFNALKHAKKSLQELVPDKLFDSSGNIRKIIDPEYYGIEADKIIDRILGVGEEKALNPITRTLPGGGTNPLKERAFLIDDLEIEDELITSFLEVAPNFINATVPNITLMRYAERLGLESGSEAKGIKISQLEKDYDLEVQKNPKKQKQLYKRLQADKRDIEATFDMLQGIYGMGPNTLDTSGAKFIKNISTWNYVRLMGHITLQALTDPGVIAIKHGIFRTIHTGVFPMLKEIAKGGYDKDLLQDLGFVTNMLNGYRLKSMMDQDPMNGQTGSITKGLNYLAESLGNATLMNTWTDAMQFIAGKVSISRTLRAISDFEATGKIKKKEKDRLNDLGITPGSYKVINEQMRKYGGKEGGSYWIDYTKWDNDNNSLRALREFRQAIIREVDQTVVQGPGIGQKPLYAAKGLGSLIFQFKGFSYAMTTKVLIPGLQRNDAEFYSGLTLTGALALVGYAATTTARGDEMDLSYDNLFKEMIDRSGITGVFGNAYNMGNKLGLIPGQEVSRYKNRGIWATLGGPSVGLVEDSVDLLRKAMNPDYNPTTNDMYKFMRFWPYQNYAYTARLHKMVAKEFADYLGFEESPE